MADDSPHYRAGFDYASLLALMRELRQRQTSAEAMLWEILRGRRFMGLKFRRQHQIGLYIADFYCHEKLLIIELDGKGHDEKDQWRHDDERGRYLCAKGFHVLRIQNSFLLEAPEQVLRDIASCIRGLLEG